MTLRSLGRSGDDPSRVLVLLPGYGDRPERYVTRCDEIDPTGEWTIVVLEPLRRGAQGPYWYDVDEDGPVVAEIDAAVRAVGTTVAALVGSTASAPESIVLAGFSQGGALALATALDPATGPPPRAVAVLAGYLPPRDEPAMDLARLEGRPVLVAHGEDDELVEPIRGRAAARALQRAGATVSWFDAPGGHRFDDPLIAPLRDWLGAVGRGTAPSAPI